MIVGGRENCAWVMRDGSMRGRGSNAVGVDGALAIEGGADGGGALVPAGAAVMGNTLAIEAGAGVAAVGRAGTLAIEAAGLSVVEIRLDDD
jgi:hypothetical protein